jgi:hypothetical protein
MKEQRARGLDDRFGLCNNVHDSFVYVFRREMLDEFLAEVIPVLRAPSRVLTHPILAPNGLTVDVEVAAGKTWAQMAEIVLAKAAV